MPERIQRKRTKGWRMPEGTIYVGRPSKYANPADWRIVGRMAAVANFKRQLYNWLKDAPDDFLHTLVQLRGKDLCCWCPVGEPCHADVWLKLANETRTPLEVYRDAFAVLRDGIQQAGAWVGVAPQWIESTLLAAAAASLNQTENAFCLSCVCDVYCENCAGEAG